MIYHRSIIESIKHLGNRRHDILMYDHTYDQILILMNEEKLLIDLINWLIEDKSNYRFKYMNIAVHNLINIGFDLKEALKENSLFLLANKCEEYMNYCSQHESIHFRIF